MATMWASRGKSETASLAATPAVGLHADGSADVARVRVHSRGDGVQAAAAGDVDLEGRRRRGWLVQRALLAADVAGLLAAFFAAELLFFDNHLVQSVGVGLESAIFVAVLPAWIADSS